MIEIYREILPAFVAVIAAVTSLLAVTFAFTQLRRTKYIEESHSVRLDRSRNALEGDVEGLYRDIYQDRGRWNELNHLLLDSVKQNLALKDPKGSPTWGSGGSRFLADMGLDPAAIEVNSHSAFVLTPFSSRHRSEYDVIAEVCSQVGITARRGDESRIAGPILPHIVEGIASSGLVIANINGRNPNVFYELGIAQALGKTVIMISEEYDKLPFDIRQQQVVLYRLPEDLREKLLIAITRAAASFAK